MRCCWSCRRESLPPIRSIRRPFIAEFQNAIRSDDKEWLADHLQLPVNYFGKTRQAIRSKDCFLKHYASVIGPELKANVLKQDPNDSSTTIGGVMIGDVRQFRRRRRRHPNAL